MSQYNTQGCW